MKRTTPFSSSIFRYTLLGVLGGCLFPLLGMVFALWVNHLTLGWAAFLELQRSQPLLWIIDTAPLFLGLAFGAAGRRDDSLVQIKGRLEQTISERTAELQRANRELQGEIDERNRTEILIGQAKKDWEATFDAISDLIFQTDDQDRITRCNLAAANGLHKILPGVARPTPGAPALSGPICRTGLGTARPGYRIRLPGRPL